MPAFNDFHNEKRIKVLIIGDSGTGKTGSIATLANEGYNVRIIDLENNLNVLNSYLTDEGKKRINYVSFDPENSKTVEGINAMIRHWKIGSEDLGKLTEWTNNDVLVIDSTTRLGDACLAATGATNKDNRTHYMTAADLFDEVTHYALANLKCNVVMLSHVTFVEVPHAKIPDTMTRRAYPATVGAKHPTRFGRGFTDIYAIKVSSTGDKVTRTFRTDADSLMGLKSSNPSKLKVEEEFNLGKIFKKLLEKETT